MKLDDVLPAYEFDERHQTWIAASPQQVLEAVETLTLAEMPVAAALLSLRQLPSRLSRGVPLPRPEPEPVLRLLERRGFVRLGEKPGREIVYGVAGPFWKLAGNEPIPIADAAAFAAFAEPGNAKAAMNFRLEPERGGTRLCTETRIAATDAAAMRSFARYWRVTRPGSGLIRILWLRAIKRRAERA